MANWNSLPVELRIMVIGHLRTLIQPYPINAHSRDMVYSAQLALVNREWYFYFANQQVVLDQHRLDEFEQFFETDSRQARVRRILFRIKLLEYKCPNCRMPEDHRTKLTNDVDFRTALMKFVQIMSTWKRAANARSGIELQIGAYSPCDREHDFFRMSEPDAEPLPGARKPFPDLWCRASRDFAFDRKPESGLETRLLGIVGDSTAMNLPPADMFDACPAPIIDSLVIRRRFLRHLSPLVIGRLIFALPNLKSFRHETWAFTNVGCQAQFHFVFHRLVVRGLPASIEAVHLIDEPIQWMNTVVRYKELNHPRRRIGRALASLATNLTRFSAPLFVEGEDFLVHSAGSLLYPKLEHLTLTSSILTESSSPSARIRKPRALLVLLFAAVTAFRNMPQLKELSLWHHRSVRATLVRFWKSDGGQFFVSLYSNFTSSVPRDDCLEVLLGCMLSGWQMLEPQRPLTVLREPLLSREGVVSHWTCFPELLQSLSHVQMPQ